MVKFLIIGRGECGASKEPCQLVRPDVAVTFYNGISHSDMSIIFNGANQDLLGLNTDIIYDLIQVYIAAIRLDIGLLDPTNVRS